MPASPPTTEMNVNFSQMEHTFFLFGLASAFGNRIQAFGDQLFEEISWRQSFMIICLDFFQNPPTIRELADLVGCSHQNARQLLNRLEKVGYVTIENDAQDRRKQRVSLTGKARAFQAKYDRPSQSLMTRLFEDISPDALEITLKTITCLDSKLKQMQGELS